MSALKQALRTNLTQRIAAWTAVKYVRALQRWGHCAIRNQSAMDDLINHERPFIACYWHSRVLMFPYVWPYHKRMHLLISRHRDGLLLARAARLCGFETIAGSSSKGGTVAYREIVRVLRRGDYVSMTPDGPRGPRMRVSPGVIHAARLAEVPIVPIGLAASRCRVLNSWDRFIIPMPFADFAIEVGDPIVIGKKAGDGEVEKVRRELEQRLQASTRRLEEQVGQIPIDPAPIAASAGMTEPVAQGQ